MDRPGRRGRFAREGVRVVLERGELRVAEELHPRGVPDPRLLEDHVVRVAAHVRPNHDAHLRDSPEDVQDRLLAHGSIARQRCDELSVRSPRPLARHAVGPYDGESVADQLTDAVLPAESPLRFRDAEGARLEVHL